MTSPVVLGAALAALWWLWIGVREWRKADPGVALGLDAPAAAVPPGDAALPISVVIPARNEAETIAGCIAAALAQAPPAGEVVLVDDRSTDATAARARAAAAGDPRLRVIAGEPPPAGWLGKPAAVVRGYRHATGDWLAFIDADVRVAPACLGRAYAYAVAHDLDVLSLAPFQDGAPGPERLVQGWVFGVLDALLPSWAAAADPAGPVAVANGQFLLVRRAAYERLGTHAAVAAKVTDDVALAQAARRVGARTAFVPAPALVRTRMYRGWGELRAGWTRTLAQAVAGGRLGRAARVAAIVVAGSVLPFAAIPLVGAPAVAACAVICAADATIRARKRQWPAYALLHPLGAVVFCYLLLRSAWREHRRKPIVWKDRDILIS